MSISLILRTQGVLLLFLGITMSIPGIVALFYNEETYTPFFPAAIATLSTGLLLLGFFKPLKKQISHREGFIIVTLGWVLATLFGSLPFVFADTFPSFTDTYFETVSGFTTTGSTVLANVEILPKSILFWRSMIQWLGGMGIILFSIAILPLLGIGGMQLYKAEVPGPVLDKMTPRIAETARSLWKIYLLLSVSQVMLLMFFGMDLFDAVCHSFTTMATGGFSTKNKSLESFNNSGIEIICIIFMFAAGINFSLHYRLFNGKLTSFFKDREFQTYSLILLIATVFISLCLTANGKPVFESIKNAAFQTVSIMTTTGYSNTNFDQWPAFNKIILFLLMFIGGSAGSTGGGIKCVRILLLLKMAYREFITMIHPHAVTSVKIAGKTVSQNILRSISVFVVCYLLLFIFGSLFMSLCGLDFMTSISSTAASLGNIGPGMAGVGPYENYQFMPDFGKWTLILLMLLGRLEIFTILIILIPEFWKK